MSTPEHNDKNIHLLASEVAENMDVACLQQYFYEGQWDYYKDDRKAFETDWKDMGMEEE